MTGEPISSVCPHCGKQCDAATAACDDEAHPNPGDFTLCIYCGTMCISGDDMGLRKPTPNEEREFARDDNVRKLLRAWSRFQEESANA